VYLYLNLRLALLRSKVQLIVMRFRLVRRFQAPASARRIRMSPGRRFPKHCLEKCAQKDHFQRIEHRIAG
jgi:hypothetical protein